MRFLILRADRDQSLRLYGWKFGEELNFMKQKNSSKSVAAIFACLAFAACDGGAKFGGDSRPTQPNKPNPVAANQETKPVPSPSNDPEDKIQKFALDNAAQPIDMIWMIDNSGSMTNKIAQVNQNFSGFGSSITSRADISVTLISKAGTGALNANLPDSLKGSSHRQIDVAVGSRNELPMLAAGFCPDETGAAPPAGTTRICGQDFNGVVSYLESPLNIIAMRSKLAAILRPGAKLVVVIVSDDNSATVTDANFLTLVKGKVPDFDPTIFSFIVDGAQCTNGAKGTSYINLAAATGGATYKICEPDWKNNFAALSEATIKIANKKFKLNADASTIASVKVDDTVLDQSKYKISGDEIEISDGVFTVTSKELIIEYK